MSTGGKQKMQDVSFRNVAEFLDFLQGDELKITELLRQIIFDCLPTVSEKLAYNVPFYKHHRNFCFLWPASILWGNKKSYEGVRFGFINGYLLSDEVKYLDRGDRKQVYWKDYKKIADINIDLLRSCIFEAILVDEQLKGKTHGIQRKTRRSG